jgi:hypothetical protein
VEQAVAASEAVHVPFPLHDRAATCEAYPGQWFEDCLPDDGLQAHGIGFLMESASKKCRLLNGSELTAEMLQGVSSVDGVRFGKTAA